MRKLYILLPFAAILLSSFWLSLQADKGSEYYGLPVVPCIARDMALQQDFQVTLQIVIDGERQIIPDNIGHDRGRCLREIHTDDSSGKIFVQSTTQRQYTLDEFFKTWKYTFDSEKILGKQADAEHHITVTVDGTQVTTYENTPLKPGQLLVITYA